MDVFVSWTRADADGGPRRLEAALGAIDGLGVWFDEEQIEPFASIPDRVRAGLGEAKVLVAWYSAAYPTRRACREELTLALLAAERAGEGPKRVLVVNPEPGLGHVLEARLLDRRFAGPDQITDLKSLAELIADRAGEVSGPFGTIPATQPARWYGGEGWQGGSVRFVGRLNQLWAIHDQLQRTTGLAAPGAAGRAVALVSGLGGVGKSLLAAEYAHLFASCYPGGVVWLSAQGNDTGGRALAPGQSRAAADAAISQVATALDVNVTGLDPAAVREAVKSALQRRGERTLWVIDDVPSGIGAADLDAWRCPGPPVAELITTRDATEGRLARISLDVLDPADALALLIGDRQLDAGEREQAGLLAAELGYHPLACDVAGLYVRSSTSFAAYREQIAGSLENFDELAAELSSQLPGDHARQITATLATSLNALGSQAWQLLRLASQLAPVAIPKGLIAAVFADLADGADTQSRLVAGERDVNRALHDAHGDGLWRFDPGTHNVDVHVLVRQAATILDPQPGQQPATQTAAITELTAALDFAADDVRRHPAIALEAQHARYMASTAPDSDLAALLAGVDALLNTLAEYDFRAGRYASARDLAQRIYDIDRRVLGDDDPETLKSANNLTETRRAVGDVAGVRDVQQRTYDTLSQVLGDDHPDTLDSAVSLALTLGDLGDLTGARDLQQRTYDTRRRVLGDDHPDTLDSAINLAAALGNLGDNAGARDLSQRTYDILSLVRGDDHPDTLTSAVSLAAALANLGDLAGARELLQRTYDTLSRVLGDDHPITLASASHLAFVEHDLGDRGAAIALLSHVVPRRSPQHPSLPAEREALDRWRRQSERRARWNKAVGKVWLPHRSSRHGELAADTERVLGPDHPRTLTARGDLAASYWSAWSAGRTGKAIAILEQVAADTERVLGPDHPDTFTARANVAGSYQSAGRTGEAIAILEQVAADTERVLGPDHPDTLTARNNLASSYWSAGRTGEAIAIQERVAADRERVLGPDHPDTLTARANLASSYRSAGRTGEAIAILEQVAADTERVLGPDHSRTLAARNNLASSYWSAGRTGEAIAIQQRVAADTERVLGPHHPDTLTARGGLAAAYQSAGRTGEAIAIQERVAADTERVLGPHHPRTLTARGSLASSYWSAGRTGEAIAILEQVATDTERVLGPHHPDTLTARNNLAVSYWSAGRTGEAIAILEQVAADTGHVLGPYHPDTLAARADLAASYRSAGRTGEAIAILEQVATDTGRLLGPHHPDTLAARANLAMAKTERDEKSPGNGP